MSQVAQLADKIHHRSARIAVVGLGYVGLPLWTAFAQHGFPMLGLDVSVEKVNQLNQGTSYIQDVSDDRLNTLLNEDRYFSTDFSLLAQADVILICVPTPLRKTKEPDLSYILAASESIKEHLCEGQLVILESTTYPGTTDEILLPLFESKGLKVGQDFLLAFSPERIDPGNASFDVTRIPKVVGGITPLCGSTSAQLYESIIEQTHQVSSARVAETAKILENTFRSVNIALVNEYAHICRVLNVDVWEVIEAAATKPFGFMKFLPGPGIGGHCIPLDPHYLIWKSRLHGFEPRFMTLADQINTGMPREVGYLVSDGLNERGKAIRGSKILLVGVAYKPNISDARETPAIPVGEFLREKGAELSFYDPHVTSFSIFDQAVPKASQDELKDFDAGVILTHHSAVNYQELCTALPLIIDTRNATRPYQSLTRIIYL